MIYSYLTHTAWNSWKTQSDTDYLVQFLEKQKSIFLAAVWVNVSFVLRKDMIIIVQETPTIVRIHL